MNARRTILTTTTAALLVTGLAACSTGAGDAAEGETTVTVIGFPGLFAEQFRALVIEPYEHANPGVTIEYEERSTSAESIGQIAGAGGNQSYDLALVDKSAQGAANEQGLFVPLTAEQVPHLDGLIDIAQSETGYGPSIYIDSLALVYNTESGQPAPDAWDDLWDGRYAGEVALAIDNAFGLTLVAALSAQNGNDYHDGIDEEIARLSELADGQVQTFAPSPDVYTAVASGSAELGLGWYARAKDFAQDNPTLDVVVPEGAGVALTPTINLVAGAPEEDAALAFLDYAIGPEAQTALARDGFYGPVSADVELTDDELAQTASPAGGVLTGGTIPDWAYIAGVTGDWLDRIKREVIAQ